VTRLPLNEYLRAQCEHVDAALDRFLPAAPACPEPIGAAMRYSLFAGGKRFRPVLVLAAAEAIASHPPLQRVEDSAGREGWWSHAGAREGEGGQTPADPVDPREALRLAMPAACAIEMIHTYSLIHDDLPAMDDDTLRRGRPTSHVVHGEGMAILAGDGLLTEAFALLSREPCDAAPAILERRMRTIREIATAAGALGMVGGQAVDLLAAEAAERDGRNQDFGLDTLRQMHAMKTGALIRASAVAGAIMAGGGDVAVAAVSEYAVRLGLAFQIVDDILDVEGATEDLGKTAGKDAAAGKPTYPALVGLDRSRELARQAFDEGVAALDRAGIARGRLHEIAAWVVERRH
jgi:geranylgeranyl diphosphate synthase, type II